MTEDKLNLNYFERIDSDDGEIHYEVHTTWGSFIKFYGNNAKADCDIFMNAINSGAAPKVTE